MGISYVSQVISCVNYVNFEFVIWDYNWCIKGNCNLPKLIITLSYEWIWYVTKSEFSMSGLHLAIKGVCDWCLIKV